MWDRDGFDGAAVADALRPFLVTLIESIANGAGGNTGGTGVSPTVPIHDLDTNHSGSLSWARLNKAGSALTDIVSRGHAQLTGLTGDDHAQYVHVSVARDISATHNFTNAVGFTSPDTNAGFAMGRAWVGNVGYDDWAGFAHRAMASAGNYALIQHRSSGTILNGPPNTAVAHRINNSDVMAMNVDRLMPAGSILKDLGDYNRKWRTLFAAELYVETLVAQSVLATIGGRIIVAPTVKLIADVNSSQTTIDTDYSSFFLNDYIYFATAPGGIAQIEVMKCTSSASAITGGYRYSVTRNLDGTGANSWVAGDAAVSLGNSTSKGYIELTSTSTIHNHLGPTITIYSRSATTNWNDVKPVVTMGNLRSFVDYGADNMGFATGNDLTLTPSTGFKGVTIDRGSGLRMFNTNIQQYASGTLVLELINNDGIGILEDAYGTWAQQRAIEWWPDLTNKTGNPSLQIRTGKIPSGPTAGQNWSQINAYPSGGQLARIDMIASGASGYVSSLVELIGGMSGSPNSEATVQASKLTANVDVLKITPFVGGSTVLSWQSTPSTAAWSTSSWTRLIELLNAGAIVWPHTGSGYSRMIGSTSNGTFYLGRSTANDASGAATYDMIADTAGNFSFGGAIRARTSSGGYIEMAPGDASHMGYIQWSKANGTPLGYMGWDNTNIYLGLENSANFLVSGGNMWVGNTSDLSGAKIQTDGNIHAVGAVVSEVFLQVYAASTPASGSTVARIFLRSSDNALCAIMPSGTVRVMAIN